VSYAKGTSVDVAASQQEIQRTLMRYGVETYSFRQVPGRAEVEFVVGDYPVRVGVELPTRPEKQTGRNPDTNRVVDLWKRHDQEVRERWRALLLFVKAGLETCELGLAAPEQVFMAFLVSPDGSTVGDKVLPVYKAALEAGQSLAIGSGR
jgi:hypothetical protein